MKGQGTEGGMFDFSPLRSLFHSVSQSPCSVSAIPAPIWAKMAAAFSFSCRKANFACSPFMRLPLSGSTTVKEENSMFSLVFSVALLTTGGRHRPSVELTKLL